MKPTTMSRKLGSRLRAARNAAGFTQERFSRLTRVDQNHVSKLERGERLPSWRTLRRLRRALPDAVILELLE